MFCWRINFLTVVSLVVAACLSAAQSPLQKGLELRYEGVAKLQLGGQEIGAKISVNDLVAEVGEKQVATVASLRIFQPEGRETIPEAALRFLSITGSGEEEAIPVERLFSESPPTGFIGQFTTLLPVYFFPTEKLKEGNSWTVKERVLIRADLLGEFRYRVAGKEKVADSDCYVIERSLLNPVVLQPEQGAQVSKSSDRIWVETKTGLVKQIQRETHLQIREGQILVSTLQLALKSAQKLESNNFNKRLKELEAIRSIHQKVGVPVLMKPTKENLDGAEKELNGFMEQFKDSPYAPHIQMWQRLVQFVRQRLSQAEQRSRLIGKEAPDFELPSLDGKKVRLSSLKGKVVVLNFFAHW